MRWCSFTAVAEALKFFGDRETADSPAPAWDKGARVAELAAHTHQVKETGLSKKRKVRQN